MLRALPLLLVFVHIGPIKNTQLYYHPDEDKCALKFDRPITSGFIGETCMPNDFQDDLTRKHECDRECKPNDQRVCHFRFVIESTETHMELACSPECSKYGLCHKCIKTDGIRTPILAANNQSPFRTMIGCKNDIFIVEVVNSMLNVTNKISEEDLQKNYGDHFKNFEVKNSMWIGYQMAEEYLIQKKIHNYRKWTVRNQHRIETPGEDTIMHFHGLLQKKTPYCDGAPFITQYPVPAYSIYRCAFECDHAGTSFVHSHLGLQRGSGAYGALIVYDANDPHKYLYDEDNIVLTLTDFGYGFSHRDDVLWINGHGVHKNIETEEYEGILAEFEVQPNRRQRVRCIFNGITNLQVVVSVDDHMLTVIALDGNSIKPFLAGSVVMSNADRVDFIINTNQKVDNYFIRARSAKNPDFNQVALLKYKYAPEFDLKYDGISPAPALQPPQMNTVDAAPGTNGVMTFSELQSDKPNCCTGSNSCQQIFLEFTVTGRGFQINNITMELPRVPLLTQVHDKGFLDESNFCNTDNLGGRDCNGAVACKCQHVVKLDLNRCYELIIIGPHPFHLHGYMYYVVAQGVAPEGEIMSKEKFLEMDRNHLVHRNLEDPVAKDTILIAKNGYAVLRFCTNNPGFWYAHCHIEFHTMAGMALVFMVGSVQDIIKTRNAQFDAYPFRNNYCDSYAK